MNQYGNTALSFLKNELKTKLPPNTALTLPDGDYVGPFPAKCTLWLNKWSQLTDLSAGRIGKIAEEYVEGRMQIEGSAREIIAVAAALLPEKPQEKRLSWFHRLAITAHSHLRHTQKNDAKQIEFHYDVSDEFYDLFLDPHKVYSCAYFSQEQPMIWDKNHWVYTNRSLASAQEAKLDFICRKLLLKPGEQFLDVGAGWGGLLMWAVERYGVQGTGITLSKNQFTYVKQLIQERGLQDKMQILLLDYRELQDAKYDKIASVGMFEHVGRAQLPTYFKQLYQLLKPGGLLLNHGITLGDVHHRKVTGGLGTFMGKYIFPGGELQHVSHGVRIMSEAGFEVLDLENLRPHYAKTLWEWSDALELNLPQARKITSEKVLRAYRLYLAGCALGFERNWMSLYQVLAARADPAFEGKMPGAGSSYPFTRDFMYKGMLV